LNTKIFHKDVQDFIHSKSNQSIDLNRLILSGSPFEDISPQELAQQISGRLKAKNKLPLWFSKTNVYYPPKLNIEQTSSEITALYKSSLVSGKSLLDVTGGFGIDDYFFAKKMEAVIHCELNENLSQIAAHNFKILEIKNIKTIFGDGLEVLKNESTLDWVYIDPSRRHDHKGKVFFLEDCLPNIPQHLEDILKKSNNILIKTSPLLDIKVGLTSLKHVKEIHVVALENEVKELLWVIDKAFSGDVLIKTINLRKSNHQKFQFLQKEEVVQKVTYGLPELYLFEPNASILKSGGFATVASTFGVKKLHKNSHLYTSNKNIDFPGRIFRVISIFPYHKKALSKTNITKANITTRNFGESVAVLRKKFKIKEGGDNYLFFTTTHDNKKVIIHCKKAIYPDA